MTSQKVLRVQLAMGLSLGLLLTTPVKALNIQIIVDNDFALFSGTSASVNTLLYQNNAMWGSQLDFQNNPVADAPAGDNYYYLVAMGGSSPEEAFGTIGGLNLTTASGVLLSNTLQAQLSGYDLNAVTDGIYDVLLTDLQNAFPNLTFSATSGTSCLTVCQGFPALSQGRSFAFGSGAAVLFAIPMEATAVPGPLPLLGVLSALHQARRLRRRTRCAAGER
jgi:hypothetical protein